MKFPHTVCVLTGGPDRRIVALDGRVYTFEDHPYCGPAVLGKRGDILENQPGPRSKFWPAVKAWRAQGRRLCGCSFCLWHPEPTDVTRHLGGRNYQVVGQVFQDDRCCTCRDIAERAKQVEREKARDVG